MIRGIIFSFGLPGIMSFWWGPTQLLSIWRCRVDRASYLVAYDEEDATNVHCVLLGQKLANPGNGRRGVVPALRCFDHVMDHRVREAFKDNLSTHPNLFRN